MSYLENLIEVYFSIISLLFAISLIVCFVYWIKLINYISKKKPIYWDKLYYWKVFPRWKNFFRFYYGNEYFNDKKIKQLKSKSRLFFLITLIIFVLIIFSIVLFGIFI